MSFVQVMSHSGGGLAADRTPFYGIKLPPEVKSLLQLSKKMEHATLRKVLKCKSLNKKLRSKSFERRNIHLYLGEACAVGHI